MGSTTRARDASFSELLAPITRVVTAKLAAADAFLRTKMNMEQREARRARLDKLRSQTSKVPTAWGSVAAFEVANVQKSILNPFLMAAGALSTMRGAASVAVIVALPMAFGVAANHDLAGWGFPCAYDDYRVQASKPSRACRTQMARLKEEQSIVVVEAAPSGSPRVTISLVSTAQAAPTFKMGPR